MSDNTIINEETLYSDSYDFNRMNTSILTSFHSNSFIYVVQSKEFTIVDLVMISILLSIPFGTHYPELNNYREEIED